MSGDKDMIQLELFGILEIPNEVRLELIDYGNKRISEIPNSVINKILQRREWDMGWIFPGCENVNESLPERTTLQRRMKKHLLDGKRFGIAKGHLKNIE